MNSAGLVTIVIPNYNGADCIPDCLESIYAGTVVPEVIIVDNGSTDGSPAMIAERFPQARILRLAANTGFCHAVNTGIHVTRTEFVMLLNDDTVLEKDCVEKLCEEMLAGSRLFAVQALMLSMQDRSVIDDAGDHLDLFGYAFAAGRGRKRRPMRQSLSIFSACAGAALYRMSCFEEIGLFDERHFCYLEDVDIGWRAQVFGWKSRCRTDAVVYHKGSASSGSRYNAFKQEMTAGNSMYMQYKNMSRLQHLFNTPAMAAGRVLKKRYFVQKGLGEAYNKGLIRGRMLIGSAAAQMEQERYGMPVQKADLAVEAVLSGNDRLMNDPGLRAVYPLYRGTRLPLGFRNIPALLRIQFLMICGTIIRLRGTGI